MSGHRKSKNRDGRKLRCESLEVRQMLSANGGSLPDLHLPSTSEEVPALVSSIVDNSFGARDQALAISAVHVLIDGRAVTLTSLDRPLQMEVGSSLEIVGIDYRLHGEEVVDGKIAFEGYLNKLRGSRVRTDYGNGRFGGHVQQGELAFGASSHPGLDGKWVMEAGTESFTLVMVRYGQDEVAVEDRLTIRTQVGTPDFVISPEIKIKGSRKGVFAGRKVKIYGTWGNEGEGRYRSHAEVNIYHESNPDKIVWVGTLADVVGAEESDSGQFVNKVRRDGFSRHWIPELGGTYTLKFYADPENDWAESNEENNVTTVKLEVRDLRQSGAERDGTQGFGFRHHSTSDTLAQDAALAGAASELAHHATSTFDVSRRVLANTNREAEAVVVLDVAFTPEATTPQATGVVESSVLRGEKSDVFHGDSADGEWIEAIDLALSGPLL